MIINATTGERAGHEDYCDSVASTPRPMPPQERNLMLRFAEYQEMPSASRYRQLEAAMQAYQLLHFPG